MYSTLLVHLLSFSISLYGSSLIHIRYLETSQVVIVIQDMVMEMTINGFHILLSLYFTPTGQQSVIFKHQMVSIGHILITMIKTKHQSSSSSGQSG